MKARSNALLPHVNPKHPRRSIRPLPSLHRALRRVGPAVIGIAASALLLGACGQAETPAATPGKGAPAGKGAAGKGSFGPGGPVTARIVTVEPQRVPIVVETVGQAEGSRQVEVRARVAGILLKRLYDEGDVVKAGAPLFQIDPEPFEIALAQARAQLAQERARNEAATREAARSRGLAEQRAISQKEADDAGSNLKLSSAALQVAEASVRQAELNLSYTRINAPVGGVTGRAVRSEGSLIQTGTESLLTTINQIDPIWVRFSVSAVDLARLPGGRLDRASGAEVALTLSDASRFPATGKINFSASQVDARLGTQELRAAFANPERRLLPGDFVRVSVVAGQRDAVFLVPQTAVLQNERGFFLFVVEAEDKAAVRPVRTGEWVGKDWTILEGLARGDRVIVDNLLRIQPGVTVKAAEGGPPAAAKGAGKPEPGAAAPGAPVAARTDKSGGGAAK